jgi:hypothetical protein
MHGFVLGADPEIGRLARSGFLEVYEFLKIEAGLGSVEAAEFLAHGMLLNTLVGIRMMDEYESNPDAREMLEGSLGDKLPFLLALDDHTRTVS